MDDTVSRIFWHPGREFPRRVGIGVCGDLGTGRVASLLPVGHAESLPLDSHRPLSLAAPWELLPPTSLSSHQHPGPRALTRLPGCLGNTSFHQLIPSFNDVNTGYTTGRPRPAQFSTIPVDVLTHHLCPHLPDLTRWLAAKTWWTSRSLLLQKVLFTVVLR